MSEEMTENEYRKLRDEDGEISIAVVKMSLADHNALVAERDALRDERDKLIQTLNEWSDQYTMVVSGKCPPDEYHCACVPALLEEIIRLRAALEKIAAIGRVEDGEYNSVWEVLPAIKTIARAALEVEK